MRWRRWLDTCLGVDAEGKAGDEASHKFKIEKHHGRIHTASHGLIHSSKNTIYKGI